MEFKGLEIVDTEYFFFSTSINRFCLRSSSWVPFSTISGDTKVSLRQKIVNAFNDGIIQVLYITKAGGEGAVREIIDLIIESRGDFDGSINKLLSDLRWIQIIP